MDISKFAKVFGAREARVPGSSARSRNPFFKKGPHLSTFLALALLTGCAAPFSVHPLSYTASYQQTNQSSLHGGQPSNNTLNALRRHGLLDVWRASPQTAIAALRAEVTADPSLWPEYFALADLSYLQARRDDNAPAEYLAAALYAYAYLAPGGAGEAPDPYSQTFQQACDIYSLGLTWALTPPAHGPAPLTGGTHVLPFGQITLTLDPQQLSWRGGTFINFQTTANLAVGGLTNTYSNSGLGDPLAAEMMRPPSSDQPLEIPSELRVATNLMLVLDNPRTTIAQKNLTGRLVIHTIFDDQSMKLGDATVPLNYDQSATLALSLAPAPSRLQTLLAFLNGTTRSNRAHLVALEPHQPGHMPVIFIHGTTSSALTWANMANDLLENPRLRGHYEFWFFSYASGNPIPYSAYQLRQSIDGAITQLGGTAADPALGEITLIGHSQGGLLAKMLVIDPGPKLWNGMGMPPATSLKLSPRSKALLTAALFPKPDPLVKSVVFLSTPQRGSFVAGFSIAKFVGTLIRLPLDVTQVAAEAFGGNGRSVQFGQRRVVIGSIQGMSPNSPFIRSLATIPIAPGVRTHSIISVNTSGPVIFGNDGVVSYESAHISGVDSELIVRSGHSSQDDPAAISEVERILNAQIAGFAPARP